uniref:Uncharacterized protein n=1 Tax=Xiphophorus couchianus TaxID=32473 RepID=A0A3B5MPK0_9TELE
MKCTMLFLVLSMVVLMAQPGECIFGWIIKGIKDLDKDQLDQEDLDQDQLDQEDLDQDQLDQEDLDKQQLDKRSYQSARRRFD